MSCIQKQSDSPLWTLLPGHGFLGINPDLKGLPKLFADPSYNRTAWNTLGAVASTSAIVAAASIIANKLATSRWDKKRAEAHRNKVNALFSFSTPNIAPEKKAVTEVRSLGVVEPKLLTNDSNTEDLSEYKDVVKKEADAGMLANILPILATIPAAMGTYALIKDDLKEVRKQDLDKEIEEKRNKLDKLYAKLLKERSDLSKNASDKNGNPDLKDKVYAGLLLPLLAAPIAFGLMSYGFTSKHDDNRAKMKMLENQVISQNLTNIPDTLEVVTGENGAIPKTRKEQKYIDDLKKAIKEL